MNFKIFGIVIERKTDILAFTAFIISIGSLLMQTVNLVKGPDVNVEVPRQILLRSQAYPDGNNYVRLAAQLIYLNKGSPGYDDITRSEAVSFKIADKEFKLTAQNYIDSKVKNKQLIITKKSDANPVQIKSGSVVVHETDFAPWPSEEPYPSSNFLKFSDLIKSLKKQPELNIVFKLETFSGPINKVHCKLLTKEFIQHLETKGWSAPVCR